jgi:hypothetical protein
MSLFGCAPKRPLDYFRKCRPLMALNGGRLVQLHRDWAVIDVPVNRSERVFYRRQCRRGEDQIAVAQAGLTSGGFAQA